MKYLFGPVPSRRLGLSLGVDLVPFKYCTLDCIYCECGKTAKNQLTLKRSEYIPYESIRSELDDFLKNNPNLDYITLTGSGEPTLNTCIGKLITFLRENYPRYKIALLTNGTTFNIPEVRQEIAPVDLVLPSLDAVSPEVFEKINRPSPDLKVEDVLEGLIEFSHLFSGTIWLEIFIIPGINDTESELALFNTFLRKIRLDRIQLNALDRPPAYNHVVKAGKDRLEYIKEYFAGLPVEIIAKYSQKKNEDEVENIKSRVLAMLQRRPCTFDDILHSTGIDEKMLHGLIEELLAEGTIITRENERGTFYSSPQQK